MKLQKLVEAEADVVSKARRGDEEIRAKMAKPGSLGLSPLLEKRRWDELIPDGAFEQQAVYDRLLVMQVDKSRGTDTFGDTSILMPATTKARLQDEACRGIIVSAGPLALDEIRGNGMDVGHYVRFIKNAPWRMQVDMVQGTAIHLLVMRAGDIVSSEDLAEALKRGECKLVVDADGTHGYVDNEGNQWKPKLPWIADDL
jgi:hypothetical protein